MRRIEIARQTIEILDQGSYRRPDSSQVSLDSELRVCITNTTCYEPDALQAIHQQLLAQPSRFTQTKFEVVNETTLQGAKRLAESGSYQRVGVLNFASARNPGGGFLNGAQAQEESLARSSGLYTSLLICQGYYDYHRAQKSCLYSDRMIYSPGCPVFREDDGTLLARPYFVDFITSPAPNAGAIQQNEPENVAKIPATLTERSAKILSLAAYHGCDALVLGAWGCGVFRNSPAMVAETFFEHLRPGGPFWGRFQTILFSVLDSSPSYKTYGIFWNRFGQAG